MRDEALSDVRHRQEGHDAAGGACTGDTWSSERSVYRIEEWVCWTPFGSPVVPEVKISVIGESGATERQVASKSKSSGAGVASSSASVRAPLCSAFNERRPQPDARSPARRGEHAIRERRLGDRDPGL